jgi:hypothetical protein
MKLALRMVSNRLRESLIHILRKVPKHQLCLVNEPCMIEIYQPMTDTCRVFESTYGEEFSSAMHTNDIKRDDYLTQPCE